jgi:5-methylcytosine-specific restriction endonuclease McrBC GTP-binding regulatory subunit McrB
LPAEIKSFLVELNSILKNYNLHFGYRVANEIALYLYNTKQFIEEDSKTTYQALDYQLIQKVFPKLNGDYSTLEEPLRKVITFLAQGKDISTVKAEETNFPNTVKKLLKIYTKLSTAGYASFIE